MPNNSPTINLVKNKKIPFIDKFMNWALTVGRLLVILTELVAVAAFVYRFSLDEKIIDLHDAIKQKQAIVSLLKNDEQKYRSLQDRIALASSFSDKNTKTSKAVLDIIDFIPGNIKLNDLTLNKDRININLNVSSISSLSDFVNPLKAYPEIKSVSIDNIENKLSSGLSVSITAMLK